MQYEFSYDGNVTIAIDPSEAATISATLLAQHISFNARCFEPYHSVWTAANGATLFKEKEPAIIMVKNLIKENISFKYSIHRAWQ